MKRPAAALIILIAVAVFFFTQCVFYVNEYQKALVLQLGEPTLPVREPGLNFKLPFIQSVVTLDTRIQSFIIPKSFIRTSDLKALEIDCYACWRIEDPLTFVRTMRSEAVATQRLHDIVYSRITAVIGTKHFNDIVFILKGDVADTGRIQESEAGAIASDTAIRKPQEQAARSKMMEDILQQSKEQTKQYGVSVIDVRIKRMDLPNRDAIFKRMNAERTKMANQYRFEGQSENLRIRSEAELERDTIIAEATGEGIRIRGEAEAAAMRIFAEAIAQAPAFYSFSKSLEVYKKAFKENTKVILSKDDPFLRFFNN